MDLDGHTGTPGPATNSPTPLPSLASAQDTIVFPRSIPAPSPLGFLPAEIRIPLYEQILYDNTGANAMHKQNTHIDASYIPTLAKLEDHHGFIISCKTIKSEFEYEWARAFNTAVAAILNAWPHQPHTSLSAVSVSKFKDSKHVQIRFSGDLNQIYQNGGSFHRVPVQTMLDNLSFNLSSFTFRPHDSLPSHDGTVRGFFQSQVFPWLLRLREALYMSIQRFPYERIRGLDYWQQEVYCLKRGGKAPPRRVSSQWADTRRLASFMDLPEHLNRRVYDSIAQSCHTMDELREYRGLLMVCRLVHWDFENALLAHHGLTDILR